ncbi:MAG: hypothetical protein ACFCGT_02485 [Sandaracinaceae bacterium]
MLAVIAGMGTGMGTGMETWSVELPDLGRYDLAGDAFELGWQGLR